MVLNLVCQVLLSLPKWVFPGAEGQARLRIQARKQTRNDTHRHKVQVFQRDLEILSEFTPSQDSATTYDFCSLHDLEANVQ
jgi:hypothetical protein